MPPKKRKAAASGVSSPSKKVRTGGTSGIPDVSPTGRPKRTSIGEPQYNFTRKRASTSASEDTAKAIGTVVEPKKRGRPAKTPAKAPAVEIKKSERPARTTPQPKTTLGRNIGLTTQSKNGRSGSAPAIKQASSISTAKPRGRPPSTKTSTTTSASITEKKKGRPPTITKKITTKAPASKVNSTTKKSNTEKPEKETAVEDDGFVDPDIQYWLMKAEPESRIEKGYDVKFSIDDLAARAEPEGWDGVRNAAARNHMRAMRKGDLAFFYHSNCAVPGVAGVMRIVEEHSVDESAFDPGHPYYDAKSDLENPKWELVKVEFVKKFDALVTLRELRSFSATGSALASMSMLKQSRLSVSPVTSDEWQFILELAGERPSLGQPALAGGYETDIDSAGVDNVNDAANDDDANGAGESSLPNGNANGSTSNNLKAQDNEWESDDDALDPQPAINGVTNESD